MSAVGLGLRAQHFDQVINERPSLQCFEVLSDNYLHGDSPLLDKLQNIRAHYDLIAHGVGLSIGSIDPLNFDYLTRIQSFIERFEIQDYSEHLCFVSTDGTYVPELLPLILDDASLDYLVARVQQVQDFLGRALILENISQYIIATDSCYSDLEFLNLLCRRTGAKILLDVNNLWLNAYNHHLDLEKILPQINAGYIAYLHLGGYEQAQHVSSLLIDTHGAPIHDQVWDFYTKVLARIGPCLTIIERDQNLPDFAVLVNEAQHAASLQDRARIRVSSATHTFATDQASVPAPLSLCEYQRRFMLALQDRQCSLHSTLFKNFTDLAFDIYRNSIISTLCASLKKIYHSLENLIGDACFTALVHEFIAFSWPTDPVLDHYGAQFSLFVREHALQKQLPYLADYVNFLWMRHTAFLSSGDYPISYVFDPDKAEYLELALTDIQFMHSLYPLDLIHEACLQNIKDTVALTPSDYYFCFMKQAHELIQYRLTHSQYWLLSLLSKVTNFMLVCERYLEQFEASEFISDIEFLARYHLLSIKEGS